MKRLVPFLAAPRPFFGRARRQVNGLQRWVVAAAVRTSPYIGM